MELSELIGQAQTLMDDGAYTRASVLCEHGLEHYPACLTLQRMLGECLLEQRFVDKAIERFQAALNVDPLSVLGRLGMGVAAEEKQDFEAAYACYLHAWEINPALQHVRDRLVKLRQMLGVDPRLHLTRAGLASVHLRAGQYDRAIAELRALTQADPDARRIKTVLAEAYWRKGDDAAVAAFSREGLEHSPENARYLALLAEIELRQSSPAAADFIARYQAVDPMGEIASLMMEWRADRDVSHLFRESAPLPEPAAAPLEVEAPVTLVMEPARVAVPEFTDAAVREPALSYSGGKVTAGLDKAIQPFVWDESPSASAGSSGVWDDWSNPAPPVIETATESSRTATASSASTSPSPSPFVTADGRLDLTVGWDDLDQALADATPQTGPLSNYTGLLSQLSVEGIAPFDASEVKGDESAWEPLFEPDGGTGLLGDSIAAAPIPATPVQPIQTQSAPIAAAPLPVAEPQAVMAPVVEAAPAASAPAPAEDEVAPFSFEELDNNYSDRAFPAHAFDDPTADLGGASRPQSSTPLQKPVEAMASALDAMFSDDDAAPDPRGGVSGPRPVERPSSVFDMLRASKSRPAPANETAPVAVPEAVSAEPPVLATRDDELPMTTLLSSDVVSGHEDQEQAAGPSDSLEAVAEELRAAMANIEAAGGNADKRVETSELEAWVQANGSSSSDVVAGAVPETEAVAEVEPMVEAVAESEPLAELTGAAPELSAVEAEVDAEAPEVDELVALPGATDEPVAEAATFDEWFEADEEVAETAVALPSEMIAVDAAAAAWPTDESAVEDHASERVLAEAETGEESEPEAVEGSPVIAESEPDLVVVESEPERTPAVVEPPRMFHVERAAPPRARSRRVALLDVQELAVLRAQLAAEEDGASQVIMAVQAKLAGRAPDRATARLLGEAHLLLGETGAAAAHFRQAMLQRVRERSATASLAR